MALKMIVTDAGIEALINAEQTGTAPVVLAAVGLGTRKYTATASQTAMRAQFKTLATVSGGVVGDNVIHLEATDSSSDQYECFEVGVFTDGGILFGIVSSTTAIIEKAAGAQSMLAIDFVVSGATPETITVGDITINVPPSTTEIQGIVELATDAETQAGTDADRAVTPKSLASLTATAVRRGLVELATSEETQAGTDTARAVTPASLASLVATEVLRGLVELATTAEATTGTDTSRAVTPAGLAAAILAKVPKSIGSGIKPVYTDANGKVVASGSTVGSATKPVFLNAGTITASGSTVGSTTNPVYMKGGAITACGGIWIKQTAFNTGNNGYIEFSNGLIFEWGRTTMDVTTTITKLKSYTTYEAYALNTNASAGVGHYPITWRSDRSSSTKETFEAASSIGLFSYLIIGKA